MANTAFVIPEAVDGGFWKDYRSTYTGGFGWRGDRSLAGILENPDHHTVTNPSRSADQDVATIANIHINGNGWGGIGYNFLCTSQVKTYKGLQFAVIAYVGDIGTIRAHTPNTKGTKGLQRGYGNNYIAAISIVGQLQNGTKLPTKPQLRSLYLYHREIIAKDKRFSGIQNRYKSVAAAFSQHRDFDFTYCATDKAAELKRAVLDAGKGVEKALNPPTPKPPKVKIEEAKDKVMIAKGTTLVVDVVTGKQQGDPIRAGQPIEVDDKLIVGNRTYYRSEWAKGKDLLWGIREDALVDPPVQPKPEPKPVPEPDIPGVVYQRLEEPDTIKVKGVKLIDFSNGKTVITVPDGEYVIFGTATLGGKIYSMTKHSFGQADKTGKPDHTTGIEYDPSDDVNETVDQMEAQAELDDAQWEQIDKNTQEISAIRKLLEAFMSALKEFFS